MSIRRRAADINRALDEVRYGPERTLNLRTSLPTGAQAAQRCEAWLRERQVLGGGEVLVITGRGNASFGGVGVVRESIVKLLAVLRRRGVVAEVREHTPGSFVIVLASMATLVDAPPRRRDARMPKLEDPRVLQLLLPETRARLRTLAERALDALGVRSPSREFVTDEMLKQFGALAGGISATAPDREAALQDAVERALLEYEEME